MTDPPGHSPTESSQHNPKGPRRNQRGHTRANAPPAATSRRSTLDFALPGSFQESSTLSPPTADVRHCSTVSPLSDGAPRSMFDGSPRTFTIPPSSSFDYPLTAAPSAHLSASPLHQNATSTEVQTGLPSSAGASSSAGPPKSRKGHGKRAEDDPETEWEGQLGLHNLLIEQARLDAGDDGVQCMSRFLDKFKKEKKYPVIRTVSLKAPDVASGEGWYGCAVCAFPTCMKNVIVNHVVMAHKDMWTFATLSNYFKKSPRWNDGKTVEDLMRHRKECKKALQAQAVAKAAASKVATARQANERNQVCHPSGSYPGENSVPSSSSTSGRRYGAGTKGKQRARQQHQVQTIEFDGNRLLQSLTIVDHSGSTLRAQASVARNTTKRKAPPPDSRGSSPQTHASDNLTPRSGGTSISVMNGPKRPCVRRTPPAHPPRRYGDAPVQSIVLDDTPTPPGNPILVSSSSQAQDLTNLENSLQAPHSTPPEGIPMDYVSHYSLDARSSVPVGPMPMTTTQQLPSHPAFRDFGNPRLIQSLYNDIASAFMKNNLPKPGEWWLVWCWPFNGIPGQTVVPPDNNVQMDVVDQSQEFHLNGQLDFGSGNEGASAVHDWPYAYQEEMLEAGQAAASASKDNGQTNSSNTSQVPRLNGEPGFGSGNEAGDYVPYWPYTEDMLEAGQAVASASKGKDQTNRSNISQAFPLNGQPDFGFGDEGASIVHSWAYSEGALEAGQVFASTSNGNNQTNIVNKSQVSHLNGYTGFVSGNGGANIILRDELLH
ncbi:SubName: Full=Uncharacterized protein {ECO:0000313/EMBL:CCA72896.1} [Serendipita indica DSM 11827]|uniref:Uncharacterized protein n=1 Tax=Serendipita indica (strain DSM 11827) TaxID=1109443 RepID=G4TNK7_SERID|nr:SubName: Full=Uncharacterized protein {ECO:0000313/EMBL:CCA72896.1} [Serendipita indica DSM 11827]CCA72896.1 hypothetical protein PIIN_06832 [Serendipita indica DSM 11827]